MYRSGDTRSSHKYHVNPLNGKVINWVRIFIQYYAFVWFFFLYRSKRCFPIFKCVSNVQYTYINIFFEAFFEILTLQGIFLNGFRSFSIFYSVQYDSKISSLVSNVFVTHIPLILHFEQNYRQCVLLLFRQCAWPLLVVSYGFVSCSSVFTLKTTKIILFWHIFFEIFKLKMQLLFLFALPKLFCVKLVYVSPVTPVISVTSLKRLLFYAQRRNLISCHQQVS